MEIEERNWSHLFRNTPQIKNILSEAITIEENKEENKEKENYLGFEWFDVHGNPQTLNRLVILGVLDIAYKSHSSTHYKLHNKMLVKNMLKVQETMSIPQENIPLSDLFEPIIGLDPVKEVFRMSLASEKPVHILLVGPRSSSKSLFLQDISRLAGARFTLGGSSTKAGLEDFILEYRPRYLVIDEMDKMDKKDFSVLYSVMEFGLVSRLKKRMMEQERIDLRVYAACNHLQPIPYEIQSRFMIREIPEYSEPEFKLVVSGFLTKRENTPEELAQYIAQELSKKTRDPRKARHVARLCKTKEQVDSLLSDSHYLWD